jgi:hypothetical protein
MTHKLRATEYLYRGHAIVLSHDLRVWVVTEGRVGESEELPTILYTSDSIDDCTRTIDEVIDG